MGYTLRFKDLPKEVEKWQALPLSLNDKEVVPLDYNAGKTGWVIYGRDLDKSLLSKFQRKLETSIVVVSAWKVAEYRVIRIAGSLPKLAQDVAEQFSLDVAPINNLPSLQAPGLLVMDMDSTAIQIECIDEIAKLYGVGEQVEKITEEAMQGGLDFSHSLDARVTQLKGADISILNQIKSSLPIMPGFEFLINELHKYNWNIAIVSGGFTFFAEHLKQTYNLHSIYANELGINKQQKLTGRLTGNVVDARYKAEVLRNLSRELEIPKVQTVSIGDGANDLMMIKIAGLGVSYHGKAKVQKKAKARINYADLTGLFCILSASLDSQG